MVTTAASKRWFVKWEISLALKFKNIIKKKLSEP